MADLREVFPILEDFVSGFGVAPTRMQSGDSFVGKNGILVFGFQDVSGNVVLPQLNASGQLPVTSTAAMVPNYLYGQGEITAGTTSGFTTIPGTTVVLVSGKSYTNIAMQLSCLRSARAQLIFDNNGSLNVLGDVFVGAGEYTYTMQMPNMSVTAGVSGVQSLYAQAFNEDKASAIRSTVGAIQTN